MSSIFKLDLLTGVVCVSSLLLALVCVVLFLNHREVKALKYENMRQKNDISAMQAHLEIFDVQLKCANSQTRSSDSCSKSNVVLPPLDNLTSIPDVCVPPNQENENTNQSDKPTEAGETLESTEQTQEKADDIIDVDTEHPNRGFTDMPDIPDIQTGIQFDIYQSNQADESDSEEDTDEESN
jgi:hypothetical protein